MTALNRFPHHKLPPVVITGTAKGLGEKAPQERITGQDQFLSVHGHSIVVTDKSSHLPPNGILVTDRRKALEYNKHLDPNRPVPAEFMFHSTYMSIHDLLRGFNNMKALHGVETGRVLKVGGRVTQLWNQEIILPNHPSHDDAEGWRLYAEETRALLGNVTNKRKVEAAKELLRLAQVEDTNLRRTSLMLDMVRTRLGGRLGEIGDITVKVSPRTYNVVRLFNDLCRFTEEIQRVSRQAIQVYGPGPTSTTVEGMDRAVGYWREHAEECEDCKILPFLTQLKPIAPCFRKAADALERRDFPTVVYQMKRANALGDIIEMNLDVAAILSPLSALRHADARKVDATLPYEVQRRQAEMTWGHAELVDVYGNMKRACRTLAPLVGSKYTATFLGHITDAGKALRDSKGNLTALDRAYEELNAASRVLAQPVTLEDLPRH